MCSETPVRDPRSTGEAPPPLPLGLAWPWATTWPVTTRLERLGAARRSNGVDLETGEIALTPGCEWRSRGGLLAAALASHHAACAPRTPPTLPAAVSV